MKKLSWEDINQIIDRLVDKIKRSDFSPDYLIGITTGGLIPLYFLAKKLDVDNVLTISIDKKSGTAIKHFPEVDLKNKTVLLIDEIAETGNSLKDVLDIITKKFSPRIIKAATLGINKDKCKFYPDFYVLIEQGEWIVFPWEKEEAWVKEGLEYS